MRHFQVFHVPWKILNSSFKIDIFSFIPFLFHFISEPKMKCFQPPLVLMFGIQ